MVSSEAILEAVCTPRILCDVAAERTDRLRRRVRSVEVAIRCDELRHIRVDHPWLDHDTLVRDIDLENAVEAREADYHTAFKRQCAPTQPRARAARHERDVLAVANAHDSLDLLRGKRQQHGRGHDPKVGQAVALIGVQLLRLADQPLIADDGPKLLDDTCIHTSLYDQAVTQTSRANAGEQNRLAQIRKEHDRAPHQYSRLCSMF